MRKNDHKTVHNDIRNLTHTDLDSCAPEVMVLDARVFSSMKNEQKYPWLYDSVVHQGYLCKFCELFCGHSSSSQEFVTDQHHHYLHYLHVVGCHLKLC
jgi:Pyruvate/2-oxoacid:ferredoxin oxidoreductase delta subunit